MTRRIKRIREKNKEKIMMTRRIKMDKRIRGEKTNEKIIMTRRIKS